MLFYIKVYTSFNLVVLRALGTTPVEGEADSNPTIVKITLLQYLFLTRNVCLKVLNSLHYQGMLTEAKTIFLKFAAFATLILYEGDARQATFNLRYQKRFGILSSTSQSLFNHLQMSLPSYMMKSKTVGHNLTEEIPSLGTNE